MVTTRAILFTLFLSILATSYSQNNFHPTHHSPLLDKWRVKHMEELKDKSIFSLKSDPNGAMWFASARNLYKYDGYNWQDFFSDTLDKVAGGYVRHILPTSKGIYLIKPNGLVIYHNGEAEAIVSRKFIKGLNMGDIAQLSNGNILASSNIGLFYLAHNKVYFYTLKEYTEKILYNKNKLNIIEFPTELKSKGFVHINALMETEKDKVWGFGNFNGIMHITFTNDTANPLAFKYTESNVRAPGITSKLQASNGDIWLSSGNDDVPIYRLHNKEWIEYWPGKMFGVYDKTAEIEETADGTILIGGVGYLLSFRNNKFEMFTNADIPLPDQIIKVERDQFDNIWLGSFGGKYYVIDYHNKRWATYSDMIYQFESNDTLWFISKDSKVVLSHKDSWWSYSQTDGLIDTPIRLIKTSRGHLWCAGSHNGKAATAFLDKNKWIKQTHPKFGWGIDKKSVFEDSEGAIWFGCVQFHNGNGGVLKLTYKNLNKLNWQQFNHENNVSEYNIVNGGIAEGDSNRLYFGTFNDVHSINKGDSVLKRTTMLRLGPVQYFKSVNNKDFWIGTKRGGLVKWSNDGEIRYNIKSGLKSNFIISFDLEDTNTIWAATDEDVSFFTNGQWITNCLPQQLNLRNVTSEIHCGNNPGTVWISHIPKEWTLRANTHTMGNDEFFTVRYKRDTIPPETSITEYSKEVDQSGNTFIAWSGIDYWNATEKGELIFSYKLNNTDWTPFEHSTGKSFVGLQRGNYTFSVRAKDKEFNIDPNPPVITFKVLPPIWMRPWFIILISVLLLTIIYLWANIIKRNKRLAYNNMELKEQKEEILVQNEEIQQQAEELQAQKDILSEQNEEISTKNEQISAAFKNTELLSDIGKKITSELDVLSIFDIIYNYVSSIVSITSMGIGLIDTMNNVIRFNAFIMKGKKADPFIRALDQKNSFSVWCINNQQPVFINNMDNEYSNYITEKPTIASGDNINSTIILPLTVKGTRIGVLVIDSEKLNAFSDNDFNNIQNLASYLSIALDNTKAYIEIHEKNKAIHESINYAQSIQSAFMPTQQLLNSYVNNFVIFKPKDIVSGDFTWFSPIEKDTQKPLKAFFCISDCTGHGVPGALVSMVGNSLLDKYINTLKEIDPALILTHVNEGFQKALKQDETHNNDGMDMALILLEELKAESSKLKEGSTFELSASSFQLTFSGAKNPCVIYRAQTGELEVLKGSRKSIGGLRAKNSKANFENYQTSLLKGDCIYIFSDGIIDQHNTVRERFTRERLLELLKQIGMEQSMDVQKEKMEHALAQHMHNEKQTDDITLMGIKI